MLYYDNALNSRPTLLCTHISRPLEHLQFLPPPPPPPLPPIERAMPSAHPDEFLNVCRGELRDVTTWYDGMINGDIETQEGKVEAVRLLIAGRRENNEGEQERILIEPPPISEKFKVTRCIEGAMGMTRTLPFTKEMRVLPCSAKRIEDLDRLDKRNWFYDQCKHSIRLQVSHHSLYSIAIHTNRYTAGRTS